MKIVVAPDSFKGSLSARQAAEAMRRGVLRADADACVDLLPIADGGEGTVDALLACLGGQRETVPVHDPLGRLVPAFYGVLPDRTVVIEAAAAVGYTLLKPAERDPWHANTFGLGELIAHALDQGHESFVIGLGGSVTNDAGVGMLAALGVRLLDHNGSSLPATPMGCERIARLDCSRLHPRLAKVKIRVACDVSAPLCGVHGATAVFGPQKGVAQADIARLDAALGRFAAVLRQDRHLDVRDLPGAGAAGGLGAAFAGMLGVRLEPGIEFVLDRVGFAERLLGVDLVLTGEGATDRQTLAGKAALGVARRAQALGIPVFCLSGAVMRNHGRFAERVDAPSDDLEDFFTVLLSISPGAVTLAEATAHAGANLSATAEAVIRAFLAGRSTVC